ncbi:MAG: Crp/Fnr family transcriptional regulator [Caldilineaceae bacterium]
MLQNSPARLHHSLPNLLRSIPYLRNLSPEIIDSLAAAASRHTYSTGATIFCEDDPVYGLCVIESGRVKVCRFTKEGREHILRLFGPGDTFNDVGVLDGGPNPATAIAFTDVTIWRIARPAMQQIVNRYPALAWAFIESLAGHTRYLVGLVEDLAMRSVKGRLAHLLLEQAQANDASSVPRYMTHEEMASHLGTVREMVGRALNSLAAADIIEIERHRIVIVDAQRLAEEAAV